MDLIELKASEGENVHPWELSRLQFVFRRLNEIRKRHSTRNRSSFHILDVGCGDAFVASEIASAYTDSHVTGYDPFFEQETLEFLKSKYQHLANLHLTEQLNSADSEKEVSVVTLLDVIEHIPDDIAVLKDLRQRPQITSQTDFLITVPAFQSLFSQHDIFMKHFRRYDEKMLGNHLAAAGFEVIEMRYFFFSLLLPRWLQVKKEQKKNAQELPEEGGVSQWRHGRFFTRLIETALTVDWQFTGFLNRIGIKLPGLSLYCLCRPVS